MGAASLLHENVPTPNLESRLPWGFSSLKSGAGYQLESGLGHQVCLGKHGGSAPNKNVIPSKLGGLLSNVNIENPAVGGS